MNDLNFLLISDPKIWSVSVKECNEPLVDLKKLGFNISPNRAIFYDGYAKVRQSVANKLIEAGKLLPTGLFFLFSEGHRPIALQQEMYRQYRAQLAGIHPDWNDMTLDQETAKYIAPPEDVPPHSTGGAIDITLSDEQGVEIDMGTILDETPDKNKNRNFTHADHISTQAKTNRKVLIDVLSRVGFVNYPAEWWHWSYGDKYWAYHTQRPYAIYGSINS